MTQTCPEQRLKESPVLLAHPESSTRKNIIFGNDGDSSGSQKSVTSPQLKQAALPPLSQHPP